jgi:two-component system response regulator HydG
VKRILLVEDDRLINDLLANVLYDEGYAVDVAATLADAMGHLENRTYNLVIADWRLPDGDGSLIVDTAAELGAQTMIMSGYLFQMPGGRADRHETLMKPIRPSELINAIEHSIGKAGAC